MKQVKIPLILAAITVVAGIFAFAPINEASTVHTSGTITLANDSIDADSVDGVVQPLSNVLTEASGDITGTLTLRCSGGTGEGTVHLTANFDGAADTLVIDKGAVGGDTVTITNVEDDTTGFITNDGFAAVIGLDGSNIVLDAADGGTNVIATVVCAAGDTPIAR